MKHTQGPWRIGKTYGSVVCDTPIPEMRGSDDVEGYGGHLIAESITKANANLIAAAPDLLEALKDALCALECCGKDYPAATKARAAIAKATNQPV
jgi:hypothetical protein